MSASTSCAFMRLPTQTGFTLCGFQNSNSEMSFPAPPQPADPVNFILGEVNTTIIVLQTTRHTCLFSFFKK